MKALITGASSGIGRDIARVLSEQGIELYLAARRGDRLIELKEELPSKAHVYVCDLSNEDACFLLYEQLKDESIDILINNAGFGLFGTFAKCELPAELSMIDTNIRGLHILTKLFLKDFVKKNRGYILNVASSAAFAPGPLMATYYATKAYVLRLTQAIYEELRHKHSNVTICALCPGPVRTEFDQRAQVTFNAHYMESMDVARYAVEKMFAGKTVIIPGIMMKLTKFAVRLVPDKLAARLSYRLQKRKKGK